MCRGRIAIQVQTEQPGHVAGGGGMLVLAFFVFFSECVLLSTSRKKGFVTSFAKVETRLSDATWVSEPSDAAHGPLWDPLFPSARLLCERPDRETCRNAKYWLGISGRVICFCACEARVSEGSHHFRGQLQTSQAAPRAFGICCPGALRPLPFPQLNFFLRHGASVASFRAPGPNAGVLAHQPQAP